MEQKLAMITVDEWIATCYASALPQTMSREKRDWQRGKETDRYFCTCWLGREVRAAISVICGEYKCQVRGVAVQFLLPEMRTQGFLITEMTHGWRGTPVWRNIQYDVYCVFVFKQSSQSVLYRSMGYGAFVLSIFRRWPVSVVTLLLYKTVLYSVQCIPLANINRCIVTDNQRVLNDW